MSKSVEFIEKIQAAAQVSVPDGQLPLLGLKRNPQGEIVPGESQRVEEINVQRRISEVFLVIRQALEVPNTIDQQSPSRLKKKYNEVYQLLGELFSWLSSGIVNVRWQVAEAAAESPSVAIPLLHAWLGTIEEFTAHLEGLVETQSTHFSREDLDNFKRALAARNENIAAQHQVAQNVAVSILIGTLRRSFIQLEKVATNHEPDLDEVVKAHNEVTGLIFILAQVIVQVLATETTNQT